MLYDAITILIYSIVIVSLFQPSSERFFAGLIFSFAILLHEFLMYDLQGNLYFISAAAFNLIMMICFLKVYKSEKMVLELSFICFTSILINLFGWLMWFFYQPSFVYEALFVALFSWALIVLTKRSCSNEFRGAAFFGCFDRIFINISQSYFYLNQNGQKK